MPPSYGDENLLENVSFTSLTAMLFSFSGSLEVSLVVLAPFATLEIYMNELLFD